MSTINFNDGIYAQTALEAFVASLSPLSLFSHSYNAEATAKGSAVYVPRIDALTATTFAGYSDTTFPYEQSGGTINTITINVDQQFISTVDLTDLQAVNSSAAEIANFANLQGKTLAKQVWQRIATLFTTVNFGAAVQSISIASYGVTAGVSARIAMAKRDVPVENLSMVINQDLNGAFMSNSTVYQNYIFNGDVARTGNIGQIAGVPVYPVNIMPTNGISLVGIIAHPDSIGVACRYLQPLASEAYISAQRMVDPGSGIVLGYRRHYNPGRGKMYASFEALFGFAVGLSLGLGILVRTD
jgi:hypothetical protein